MKLCEYGNWSIIWSPTGHAKWHAGHLDYTSAHFTNYCEVFNISSKLATIWHYTHFNYIDQ